MSGNESATRFLPVLLPGQRQPAQKIQIGSLAFGACDNFAASSTALSRKLSARHQARSIRRVLLAKRRQPMRAQGKKRSVERGGTARSIQFRAASILSRILPLHA